MIIPVSGGVIFAAYIDNCVACCKDCRVSGADEGGRRIRREKSEEIDGEGFISVKVAAGSLSVSTTKGRIETSHMAYLCVPIKGEEVLSFLVTVSSAILNNCLKRSMCWEEPSIQDTSTCLTY